MKNLVLCFLLPLCFVAANSRAQVGKRWYSYGLEYLYNVTSGGVGYDGASIWNDTTALYGYTSAGTPAYFNNKFTSVGMSFAPVLPAWNNVPLYGSTIKVGPADAYTIDSVRIYGGYFRNNAKPLPVDTLRLSFVYGEGSATTNLPEYSLSGLGAFYGYDPVDFLGMQHDSVNNRAGNALGVATSPYVQSIPLHVLDTSSNFSVAYALSTPYAVPAGNKAGMSLSYKSGDASFTPFDTVVYADGTVKYGEFIPLITFAGGTGSPAFPTYDPTDSNVGYFKEEGAGDGGGFAGVYVPTWAWLSGGTSATELQYPVVDFHINCPTCDLSDAITGTASACIGSASDLAFSLAGGTWSSSNTAIATVVTGTGVVTGVSDGVVTITYTLSGHHAYIDFTVGAGSTIFGVTSLCAGTATTLTGSAGPVGTWSSSSTGVATIDLIAGFLDALSPGTTVITYTPPSGFGCPATTTVTVSAAPGAITGTMSVCVPSTTPLSDGPPGGTWSSSNTFEAVVGLSSGVVSGVSAGTPTITYTTGAGCFAITTVTVNTAPVAGIITGVSTTVCAGASISLSDASPGGVWSSSSTGIATVNTTGGVTGAAGGSAVISYTVTNSCGAAHATLPVTVYTSPGAITGVMSVCAPLTTTLSDGPAGGTWSSGSTATATVGLSSGVVTGISAGAATISYTTGLGCFATAAVTVNSAPAAGTVTGASTVCTGVTISLIDGSGGGAWSSGSTSIATVNSAGVVTGVATGSTTISYTVTNSCGSAYATAPVTVNPSPDAGTITTTGRDSVCPGYTISFTDLASGGTWSSSNTAIATVSATGTVNGVSSGGGNISYSVTNSCGTANATFPVTVLPYSVCALGTNPATASGYAQLQIFPNPNDGTFTMNLLSNSNEQAHIIITNIVGEKVQEFTTATNKITDIKLNQAPGIYLLSATTADGKYVAKITVQ